MARHSIRHAIIACHPSAESFTIAVAGRYAETVRKSGQEAIVRDLYRMNFDPVLKEPERHGQPAPDVADEWSQLGNPDVFVLVYPIWYGAPPAVLKGYIERVLGAGRTAGFAAPESAVGRVAGKLLVTLTSSGQLRAWLEEKGIPSSLRTIYDYYLSDILGLAETRRYHFDGVTEGVPEREIRTHLAGVETAAREAMSRFVNAPPDMDPYRHLRSPGR